MTIDAGPLFPILVALVACGGAADSESDAGSPTTDSGDGSNPDAAEARGESDDFERATLGPNWTVRFPDPDTAGQVQIVDDSDLGLGPGPQGFFLINWTGDVFDANQFCEATIPLDATADWAHMVYVRWRASDRARYGFAYNNDPSQATFGEWIFKYDGVPTPETRVFATAVATVIPLPGDTIRVEVSGFTLRGYLNGELVLEATDTDSTRIANGEVGLAARWASGNQNTNTTVKVWESWAGGSL